MMAFIQTVAAALVALGILVTIHEFGHFWVARRCQVKVLRFSIGFGKALYRWYDRRGTEYVIAMIPLGGYVKMLDEREGEVPSSLLDQAFNRKPVGQRIAIVAAGPLVNLLFAVLAYWVLFVSGISTVAPVVGVVTPDSPAGVAGLQRGEEIVAVDGFPTRTWEDVSLRLAGRIGETGTLSVATRELDSHNPRQYQVPLHDFQISEDKGPLVAIGIQPYYPDVPPRIGQLLANDPAVVGGMQEGDLVTAIDGVAIKQWSDLVDQVKAHPGQALTITVDRNGQSLQLQITPQQKLAQHGQSYGYIGAAPKPVPLPDSMLRNISYSPWHAITAAAGKTWQMIDLTLESIWKMIQGAISVKNLSGPITIAKVASASAQSGVESFLNFLAYLSISLGVLNLLPIPVLDGGHLLYYFAELVRGKPVPEKIQLWGLKVGMALLMTLMLLALYNDLVRL